MTAPLYYKDNPETHAVRNRRRADAAERLGLGRRIGGGSKWAALPASVRAAALNGPYIQQTVTRKLTPVFRPGREGAAAFRHAILARDGGCVVTGTPADTQVYSKGKQVALIQAAHIKPFRLCEDGEYCDPENGLAMRADVHAAFDAGLFTIGDDGSLIPSRWLIVPPEWYRVSPKLTLRQRNYLEGHRRWAFSNWERWAF